MLQGNAVGFDFRTIRLNSAAPDIQKQFLCCLAYVCRRHGIAAPKIKAGPSRAPLLSLLLSRLLVLLLVVDLGELRVDDIVLRRAAGRSAAVGTGAIRSAGVLLRVG